MTTGDRASDIGKRRILLFSQDEPLAQALGTALAPYAIELDVAGGRIDGAELPRILNSSRDRDSLVVCDFAGEDGLRCAFFVARESRGRQLAFLALDEKAENGPVATLIAGLAKALPEVRVVVVTDRVVEDSRAAGSPERRAWTPEQLAAALRQVMIGVQPQGEIIRLHDLPRSG